MANQEHLDMLHKGVEIWNRWRKENPGIGVDLREAKLTGVNLTEADLKWVNLKGADLSKANLSDANLTLDLGQSGRCITYWSNSSYGDP